MKSDYAAAAEKIESAEALLIGAGAGMGVDSGLPDFRGTKGFWKAYPPIKRLGLSFYDLANPRWFVVDPSRAWGFYGHRRNLYQQTHPHSGFSILHRWIHRKVAGGFVFTSNVDGHFQSAGFDNDAIVECHGAIGYNQCSRPCGDAIWHAGHHTLTVDAETLRARGPLPQCGYCGSCARPNILMFADANWIETRTGEQLTRYRKWLESVGDRSLAIVELGAGRAVPTVRYECERLARLANATLVRINPREPNCHQGLSLAARALPALQRIDSLIAEKSN